MDSGRERSTETAANSLIYFVESGFNEKKVSAVAFIDMKSAFDSVWHLDLDYI